MARIYQQVGTLLHTRMFNGNGIGFLGALMHLRSMLVPGICSLITKTSTSGIVFSCFMMSVSMGGYLFSIAMRYCSVIVHPLFRERLKF